VDQAQVGAAPAGVLGGAGLAARSRVPLIGYVMASLLAVMGFGMLALDAPRFHGRVVLEPDRFIIPRTGFSWTPPAAIRLGELKVAWLHAAAIDERHMTFVMSGGATPVEVPIGDVLSAALPEFRRRLNAREVDVVKDVD
jgi:hypothetical protein